MRDVFLCDAVRTPIGRYAGSLAKVRTDDLAAVHLEAHPADRVQHGLAATFAAHGELLHQIGDAQQGSGRLAHEGTSAVAPAVAPDVITVHATSTRPNGSVRRAQPSNAVA